MTDELDPDFEGILGDTSDYVDATVGLLTMVLGDGRHVIQKDYRVKGEVWRVHKNDADPYPSKPHAHCIAGAQRFIGLTLHLGTAQLYDKRKPLDRYLNPDQFQRLVAMIQPKFPDIKLPLPTE